jgi:hypothetical protein
MSSFSTQAILSTARLMPILISFRLAVGRQSLSTARLWSSMQLIPKICQAEFSGVIKPVQFDDDQETMPNVRVHAFSGLKADIARCPLSARCRLMRHNMIGGAKEKDRLAWRSHRYPDSIFVLGSRESRAR